MNVLLKTEKTLLAGCVENTVVAYAGFSSTCLNMVCGNLDSYEIWNITSLSTDSLFCLEYVEITSFVKYKLACAIHVRKHEGVVRGGDPLQKWPLVTNLCIFD